MRSLLHCQHSMGLGHLVRTLRLADALLDLGPVCVICGGEVPAGFPINPNIILKRLPSLNMATNGILLNPLSDVEPNQVISQRAKMVQRIAKDFHPDIVIVEMYPFGRKKFAKEILALLGQAHCLWNVKILCSVRDVLITKRRDQCRHDQQVARCLNTYFDTVLVHADPNLVRLEDTFFAASEIHIPKLYTGYIAKSHIKPHPNREPRIVVSAGGGRAGKRLIDVAIAAMPQIKSETKLDMHIITGPLSDHERLFTPLPPGLKMVPFEPNLPELLARSSLSISQCGYNTVTDILLAEIPAIFVPFESETEDEQFRRAEILTKRNRATMVREKALTPDVLLEAIRQPRHIHFPCDFNLHGADASRDIIKELYKNGNLSKVNHRD